MKGPLPAVGGSQRRTYPAGGADPVMSLLQAQKQQATTQALSTTGLSTSALSITGGGSASSSGSTLRTSLAVYGAPATAAGKAEGKALLDSLKLADTSAQRGVDFLPPLSETPRTDEPTSCGSGPADAELESLPAASTAASTDNATCASEVAAAQWLSSGDGASVAALDCSPTDVRDELVAMDDGSAADSRQAVPGPPAAALRVEDLERQMVQLPRQGGSTAGVISQAGDLAKLLKLPSGGEPSAARSEEVPQSGGDEVQRSPVERRIAPESGKEYSFDELMEAWNEEYTLEDVEEYWESRMLRKEEREAEKPAVVEQPAEPDAGSKEGEEQSDNSGRLLLLLLKGTQVTREPGAAGVLPERLRDERWEPLLQPFIDVNDPKRFVGADQFGPGHGVTVTGSGSQPVVLKDISKSDILVMFKPSGWATCSTPQWEGVEGNLIRYIWQRHANCSMAAPCHRLDRGTSGAVVVAKTRNALRHIATQITSRTLVKQYFGLCHGKIDPPQGALSLPLALSSTDKPLGACAAEGRPAVTRYRVLGYFSRPGNSEDEVIFYSLVQLQIDHGRQHQIRLHMASMGHPIVYDAKYNASSLREDAKVCSRLYLHAAFVQCSLPPDGAEMLRVACRLPQQLKQALTSSLERERSLENNLPMEGVRLCDCLLDNEPGVSSASLFEARLAARRRNDFLKSFNFSSAEKDEVHRLLAKLPTAEERSSALLRFRVLGERTPDFIVTRFARYVDGLLKQRAQGAKSENAGQADSASTEKDALDFSAIDPVNGYGPVIYHTEHITCEVCGALEKVDVVLFPAMQLGLRCRSLVAPPATMPMTGPLARLLANANHAHHAPVEEQQEANRSTDEEDEEEEEEEEEEEDAEDEEEEEEEEGTDEQRQSSDAELSAELISVLKEHGGTMNGPLVASRFASRYNAWVRKDSRRNDGSLRRWIGQQPGVSVEHCGGNRWKVHLDMESVEEEEEEEEDEEPLQWGQTKRGPRKAWHRKKPYRGWR